MEKFLIEVFGEDSFTRPPEVDRAHRTLRPPQPTGPLGAMVVRMHYYQTKEQILRISYERGQLTPPRSKDQLLPRPQR